MGRIAHCRRPPIETLEFHAFDGVLPPFLSLLRRIPLLVPLFLHRRVRTLTGDGQTT
jgi:hypothetical protein